jgi:hypothetical protein
MTVFHVLRELGYIPAACRTGRPHKRSSYMAFQIVAGTLVSLLTFCIHGLFTVAIIAFTRHAEKATRGRTRTIRMFALFGFTMVLLNAAHLIEIAAWTAYYEWAGIPLKDVTLFEFAFENYTALGYGDVVAPAAWRLTGPITSLNGLLLIGWSVAIIFEVLRMAELQFGRRN